ncbi:hypothetical protein TWF730_002144 [Orbilia blumenaviensis]|uniref:RNase III domain-containing protein n=1 Tax=Orbilia blumenaviensis TaxID=1796055 RepID=A0AAV9UD28_9PEZI
MARLVDVKKIQGIIGYVFKSDTHLIEAFQSTGYARAISGNVDGHKRLALLGDAVLGLVQLDQWYQTQKSRGGWYTMDITCTCIFCKYRADY